MEEEPRTTAVADRQSPRRLLETSTVFEGKVWDVLRETFTLNDNGESITREFIQHPGAVAILAMDEKERVLLIRQYRHPVRMDLWEIPTGLLDMDGEDFVDAAARELAEEADVTADTWHVLADLFLSPGSSSEALRIYLAQGVTEVPHEERHTRTHEEAEIELAWVPLQDAVDAVLGGRIHSPSAAAAVLAAAAAKLAGYSSLRPADSPWPEHPSQHGTWPSGPVLRA
ncbi:ADP-ribose pyrophosphatase [Arthrobacter pigmenti]|uniref:ADP-ribose pyrophosphatase n=1 Tax=Arthrobacter pigmenti TaxID=271432 RepID=A0A846RFQ8_9MICC|nr:NUDIX hydrolase [Arthrobacter pigmenti]NJC22018.1 ADP-ribose pyrophosphatase [Arthrobacter pigmenti]